MCHKQYANTLIDSDLNFVSFKVNKLLLLLLYLLVICFGVLVKSQQVSKSEIERITQSNVKFGTALFSKLLKAKSVLFISNNFRKLLKSFEQNKNVNF